MKKITSLLIGVVLAASGCQKTQELKPESVDVPANELGAIETVDGRLKFENQATYDKTMKYLVGHQAELATWEKRFQGFVSMRRAYELITTEEYEQMIKNNSFDNYQDLLTVIPSENEKEIVFNIEDRVASTVVNNHGLVQIGSDVYKIGREKVVKFTKYTPGMERNQYSSSDLEKGIAVSAVKRNYYSSPSVKGARKKDEINNLNEYWVGSSKRRLIGTVYDWSLGLFDDQHIGLQTKHQRRFMGAWFAESIPKIGLEGNGSYQAYENGIPTGNPVSFSIGPNFEQYNQNYLNYTLQYGGPYGYSFVSVSSRHYGTCTDGSYRQVNF